MSFKTIAIFALTLALGTQTVHGQTYRYRYVQQQPQAHRYYQGQTYQYVQPQASQYFQGQDGRWYYYVQPQPQYAQPQAQVTQATYTDEAATFLAALNLWRQANGRGPLSWSSVLASYAATNRGIHDPGSSGGASQCWAYASSLMSALEMWKASSAHSAILLNAVSTIGASPCPSGCTANAQ